MATFPGSAPSTVVTYNALTGGLESPPGTVITGATSYTLAQFLVLTIANYANRTILISDIPAAHSSVNGILVECNAAGTGWRFIQIPSFTQALMASAGITASVASGWGRIFISDLGVGGSYWRSNGTRFRPAQQSIILFDLTSNVALTGQPITIKVIRQLEIPKLDGKSIWGDNDILVVDQILEKTGTVDLIGSSVYMGNTSRTLDDAETNTAVVCSMATSGVGQTELGSVTKIRRISSTSIKLMGGVGTLSIAATGAKSTPIAMTDIDTATTYLDSAGKFTPTTTVADTALTLTTHTVTLIAAGA